MESQSSKLDKKLLRKNNEILRQTNRNLLKQKLRVEEGWLLKIVERVDYVFYERFSLLNWLTRWIPRWYGNMSVVESYVIGWFLLEVLLFALIAAFSNLAAITVFVIPVLILLIYRWQNIISYWFHTHVLTVRVASPVRTFLLTLINFAEIVTIFAILDFLLSGLFSPAFAGLSTSLDYSIRIITTLGWDKFEPAGFGYVLFYLQIFSGIGTVAIVIGSVLSYFERS